MKIPRLPAPTNFAEGQRALFGCLVAFAGMFCGACSVGMIALLMWGGWSEKEEHTIVVIFGWSLGGFIASMAMVIGFLAVGGPVGRFKAGVSKDGANLEVSDATPSAIAAAASGAAAGAVSAAGAVTAAAAAAPPPPKPTSEPDPKP